MNEIEKLYENCGIKPNHTDECKLADIYWNNEELADEYGLFDNYIKAKCPHNQECTDECEHAYDKENYPPFTAEKQLELIKWLCQNTYRNYIHFRYERDINNWKMECNMVGLREYGSFEECFAGLINSLWQDLTEEEKEQIRGILK